mgnify:CR=1 FL=1
MIDPRTVEQGSAEWLQLRLGCVSASTVSDVMAKGRNGESATRNKLKLKLAAERMTKQVQESFTSAAIEWGREQEQFAAMAYEAERGVFLEKTGWWTHPTIQWLGVSPDRLLDGDGLVEIKCPNSTTMIDWIFADRVPPEYIKQIQCQLWVTARKYCDFCAYDKRLPKRNQLWIKRVERDNDLIKTMEAEVVTFLSEVDELVKSLEA